MKFGMIFRTKMKTNNKNSYSGLIGYNFDLKRIFKNKYSVRIVSKYLVSKQKYHF